MSLDESTFRAEALAWCEANLEPRVEDTGFTPHSWMKDPELEKQQHADGHKMRQKLYAAGYVGISVPTQYGGQGGEAWMERVWREVSQPFDTYGGYYDAMTQMMTPALLAYGTEEQKLEHLPPLLRGDKHWAQLFSEPGAGSDLAGLGARAIRDGDEYIINGQKVWNSMAHVADMGFLLVRTNPDAPKHQGITFLMIDMHQDGVEARPLVQATGAAQFCEVFLTDARCPVDQVLGEIDGGWGPARVVLGAEATLIGNSKSMASTKLRRLAQETGRDQDPVVRQQLAQIHTRELLVSQMSARLAAAVRRGEQPPFDPSVVKIFITKNREREGDLAMSILAEAGIADGHDASIWAFEQVLFRFAGSIGGGTTEVHKNNVAERTLGLPRDIRNDKDIPWSDVPR